MELSVKSELYANPANSREITVNLLLPYTRKYEATLEKHLSEIAQAQFVALPPENHEQARTQGNRPTWSSMDQSSTLSQSHTLLLATTDINTITWQSQLKAVKRV